MKRATHEMIISMILLLTAIISVQSGASLAKGLFPIIGASGVTAMRLGFSAIILLLVFRPWRHPLPKENRRFLLYYALSVGTMNFLFYQSLKTLPIGIAVGLEFIGPLLVAFLSSRRPIDFIWIILVIIGLLLLLPLRKSAEVDLLGSLFALSAGGFWALYIVFGAKAGKHFGPSASAIGLTIAALIYVPVGIAIEGEALFNWHILPLALGVALLSSAIPFALEILVLTRIPQKTFGTLTSLGPAFGALSGYLFLGELLTFYQWFALLIIIIASIGSSLSGSAES